MPFLQLLSYGAFDILFCTLSSSALAYTLCSAFYATQPFQQMVWLIVLACFVVTFALYVVALRARLVGGIVFGVAALAAIVACALASPVESVLDDEVGNYTLFALIAVLTPLLTFLLSRKRASMVLLVVLGVYLCAVIEYLYWYGHVAAFLLFVGGCVALLVYRSYQLAVIGSDSDALAFPIVSVSGAVLVALALALSAGVFVLVVEPLDPPNLIVKLITEHVRLDEEEVRGTGDAVNVENDQLFSLVTNDIVQQADNPEEEDSQQDMDDTSDDDSDETEENAGASVGLDEDGDRGVDAQRISVLPWGYVLIPLLLAALVAGVIALRRRLRNRRFQKLLAADGRAGMEGLYLFFMRRFKKLKLPVPANQTLLEFLQASKAAYERFEDPQQEVRLAQLTDAYIGVVYGGQPFVDGHRELFSAYYREFYKNARRYVGRVRYCFKFFVL